MTRLVPWAMLASALVGTALLAFFYWDQLPARVASHFGPGGQANGWMSKPGFVAVMLATQVGVAAMMLGVGYLIRVLPTSMINIPNREYWLAESRRDRTLRETASMMAWIAAGTAVFLMVVYWLTLDANVDEKGLNSTATWISTIVFIAGLIGFCVVRLSKYYRVPTE
ncbi:DUF1648 domain-containing protein [Mariniblastus fucicola]|uniref:DUF1648 domain-containing protein n=1 Tax=Mariniblastus fucicola TaxID=980251 RepID=A0A5B9P895_9BACT|nr:DUF1648 domain-containing protein [Mariniblastus fucicola]QEG21090.1 hypothetical protein MFFC18_09420 [Mariniblastus fucicola]